MDKQQTVKVGQTPEDRPIAPQDSLSYNAVLQSLAQNCLHLRRASTYGRSVAALRTALTLDLDGLPFKQRIEAKAKEIDRLVIEYQDERIRSFADGIYYEPQCVNDLTCMHKDILRDELYCLYNDTWLEFLLQLLGEHSALISAKPHITEGSEPEVDIRA